MKIFKFVEKYWASILILLSSFWAVKALLVYGFFTMHDDEQIARLYELNNVILQGQIPPRWVSDLGFGFGYPLFNFYPPFVYYLGEIFHTLGFSLIDSTKIVMILGFLASAIFMYLWVRRRYGELSGIFAAILYTYAPYHSVDLYVRGALSEFFSWVFIPAVFWATDRLFVKRTSGNAVVLGISLACLVLTHNLTAMVFIPFYLAYVFYMLYGQRGKLKKVLPQLVSSGIIALELTAYFWLPALAEKKYTLTDAILTRELASYTLHFVCLRQLWNSQWGYGGSISGCSDGLSFEVGKIHIIFACVGVVLALYWWWRKRKQSGERLPILVFSLFGFALFMTTTYSKFIWDHVSLLWYQQFPWRFLVFAVAFAAFMGGYVFGLIDKRVPRTIAFVILIILSSYVISTAAGDFYPKTYLRVSDSNYLGDDIKWRVSGYSFEYVPKGVTTRLSDIHTTQLAITKSDIPRQPYKIVSGNMKVDVIKDFASSKELRVSASVSGALQINTYSFPGWKVYMDNNEITYSDKNKLHLIQFAVPVGIHKFDVIFTDTWPRILGNIISAVTIIFLIILGFWRLLWSMKARKERF